ncbi:GntR family transcriptional regulator [Roseivivax sp. THAF30]|uniref:GntR family transcriptional regulator n=1 Tax=Roseivivax sp. THAF30 TaxID=2587852 RepID=UPI0012690E37|nr:GntR family transcriptional regulator [Roseivivax sp. THAF30]QFT61624.1 HTH-type transcriptional regulator McbR [Roseivivax sp. THAF30]
MNKTASREDMSGPAGLPAHEQVYRHLREMILFGELAPGQAVTIQGLTETLGAGMTPVREALRRLTAEGALDFQGNRRIAVPVLDHAALEELTIARRALEPELARRAAERASPDVVEALSEIDTSIDTAIRRGDVPGYLIGNHAFHARINACADAAILTGLVEGLWLRFGPSLRVVCGRFGTEGLPDRHKDLLNALSAGDADAAASAMDADVCQGMEQIALGLGPARPSD